MKILVIIILLSYINTNEYFKKCKQNIDCEELSLSYECNIESNLCKHVNLITNNKMYISGFLLLFIVNILTSVSGMGGGSLIIPIAIFMFDFNDKFSVPIAKANIFISALLNSYFILNLKHNNKSCIDFNMITTTIPFLIGGTIIGVYLNTIVSNKIIIVGLFIVILISTLLTLKNLIKYIRNKNISAEVFIVDNNDINESISKKTSIIANMSCMFTVILLIYFRELYKSKEYLYYVILLLSIFSCILFGLFGNYLNKDKNNSNKILIIVNFFAGICSGLFGIGGSTILIPILLLLNYNPIIVTAISGYSVFYSSMSTTSQYLILGAIEFPSIIYLVIFSLLGTIIGGFFLKKKIQESGNFKYLMIIIFILFCLSSILIGKKAFF